MTSGRRIPNWKLLAALGLLLCLLALLAHPVHALSSAALLVLPALLFGLVPLPRSLGPFLAPEQARRPRYFGLATLFQRPPPRFSR
jgi:hypothetical protein